MCGVVCVYIYMCGVCIWGVCMCYVCGCVHMCGVYMGGPPMGTSVLHRPPTLWSIPGQHSRDAALGEPHCIREGITLIRLQKTNVMSKQT